jgi:AraC-like DNA-binding protein
LKERNNRRYQILAQRMQPLDTIVLETPSVRAARFRCAARDPRFRDTGPANNFAVCFPRRSVWIRYSGSRSFVADPSLATIYHPGQEYTREAISADGDYCEWFGVSASIAIDIDQRDEPFAARFAPVDRRLYLEQRQFFTRVERGLVDQLEAEETIIRIVSTVISDSRRSADKTDRDERESLVQKAKELLSRNLRSNAGITWIASQLGVSPFHLCRIFRSHTGETLHEFKTDLRLRSALEDLADRKGDISRIAHEFGFSSHSHFTAAMRARFGVTPSELKTSLRLSRRAS